MIIWLSTMLKASPSIFIAIVYGGIAILIFCVLLIYAPYSHFKYQQKKDIEFEESQKAKYKEQRIIEMPSSSIQMIKEIIMESNQSLSIKRLSLSKRKKLDTFRILCFCGVSLRKGSPHSVYDDTHYDPRNKCYACYICHRLFHFESDSYLLFSCPQNIIPIHYNGFVICIYCVWTIYIYQKNIKYYKHFVHNETEERKLNYDEEPLFQYKQTLTIDHDRYLFDDDMDDMDDSDSHSMDSYHQRNNKHSAIANAINNEKKAKKKKNRNRSKIELIKKNISKIAARRFSICTLWNELMPLKHIYIAVLLYIIDTSTDISVTVLWGKRVYTEHIRGIEPDKTDNVNIVGVFLTSIILLLFYRIVSCVVIYRYSTKSWPKTRSFLQLFDLLLFWELYCSHFIGKKTENFLLISKMKALFESCPQSIIQTFIIVRSTLVINSVHSFSENFILYLSLISAVISILHRFNLEDSYVFERSANKKWPPSIGYTIRTCFRIFEIVSRLLVFSLISTVIGERMAFLYAGIDFYINLRLYRKGLIGPSWMNVVGYMISVVDLASVPAPNTYQHNNNSAPGTRDRALKLIKSLIFKLIQFSSALFTMIMGFWIPYVIGCCNKYLDHFGFVMITSRFYQHTVLLVIMWLMLVTDIILCTEPLCTSDALRDEIRNVSIILIIVAFICTILSFVCYIIACKYLKIGVIATERNPWLAVRVGDIYDALMIFEENASDYNIKSHQWKRNVFWKKFISSKYSIPNIHDFSDKNVRALYRLLTTEDENNWDIPLIKDIAFDAVKIKFTDIFKVFFHPILLSENDGISPLLNVYTCIDNKGNYILHEAAKSGCVDIIYILLTRGGSNIPVLNRLNETPLHLASRGGNMTVIAMLLNAWSLTTMDKNGRYPIHYGVETANKQIVSLMMKHINHLCESQYNDDNIWSQMIGSLLLTCAQNSNQNMFEYILKNKSRRIIPNVNYKLSTSGLSALHYAVLTRNINIVKILLSHDDLKQNIDINLKDNDNITPLMIAVENDDAAMVQYLLDCDPNLHLDINIQTAMNGYTALHFAFLNGKYNKDIISQLLKHPGIELMPDYHNEQTPLHLAALHHETLATFCTEILNEKQYKLEKEILDLGKEEKEELEEEKHHKNDIKKRLVKMQLKYEKKEKNDTPQQTVHGNEEVKQQLMEGLLTVGVGSNNFMEIASEQKLRRKCIEYYWIAIENNDYEITDILLQHKQISVDAFVRNGRFIGQTALHIVCTLGHYETLSVLMNHGATVNIESKIDSATPLLLAVRFNHITCATHLVKHDNIDVNIAALDETTPFYESCFSNNVEMIKLLLSSPRLNIAKKTRNKRPIDIICDENTLIMIEEVLLKIHMHNKDEIHRHNDEIHTHNDEIHTFESQICKYLNIALEEHYECERRESNGAIEIFDWLMQICVLPNLNRPFLFLHVLCKEGHFNLLKYLIHDSHIQDHDINWIVKDEHMMYPIQYLVEWFQFPNKETSNENDSQWTLSYILQRTFTSLMFNKMESVMWINCTSAQHCCKCNKSMTIDWNKEIKPPLIGIGMGMVKNQITINIDDIHDEKKRKLNNKHLMFLNNIIISLFGLTNCGWINATINRDYVFDPRQCVDVLNVRSYYDAIRRSAADTSYCSEYQLNDIQDIAIYLDAMNSNTPHRFPTSAFNSLCTLLLDETTPLHILQYLCDLLRNLLFYPSSHPFVADLIFIEKMLSKICMEMEEYFLISRDGSALKNELSVFMIEATAISATANCYKYPTAISQHILDIAYPLLSHDKSPTIRLMTGKLLYNISLQIKMKIHSTLYRKELNKEFGETVIPQPQPQPQIQIQHHNTQSFKYHMDVIPINEEQEDDNDSEDDDIYGTYVGIDEDELKMERETSMNKNKNKNTNIENNKIINVFTDHARSEIEEETIQSIQNTLFEHICDGIVDRLNHENDVRVRCICLQTLGLLILDNAHLIQYINDAGDEYIQYDIWKRRDSQCCINRDLYSNIIRLLPKPKRKPSSIVKLKSKSMSGRQLSDRDIEHCLVKPIESLSKLQGLEYQQLSKALSSETRYDHNCKESYSALNDDEYYLDDEFKFDQARQTVNPYDPDGDEDTDEDIDDEGDGNQLLTVIAQHLYETNPNINTNTNNGARLKKIYSEGLKIERDNESESDNDDHKMRETVLKINTQTPNAPEMAFSTMLSAKTLKQMSEDLNHDDEDKLRAGVGFAVGHAANNEHVSFVFKHNNAEIANAEESDKKNDNESDDDILLNNTYYNELTLGQ